MEINRLTKNEAIDNAPYGIRVNSVNMVATDTPMIARAGILVAAAMSVEYAPKMGRITTDSISGLTQTSIIARQRFGSRLR
ncbi:hypothetical protein [Paracoccus aestuariivivens]|uniref:Uncharacterized protein n=1 Tax=Paracoccus aestuariivivens TaxID=1820333 RepID=A0A6L6JEA0_9RHOB|nr:hypothetical protein [Paracoccus aestuariivivens]MTH80330.1 hypothetical protein [Paracoccus aestuariivivens]